MHRLFPLILFALAACASQGDKEAERYRLLAEATDNKDSQLENLCQQAQLVVQAYHGEGNEAEYRRWKATADLDCASEAEWEHLAS